MGCRILYDREENLACMYCSVVDLAFGPVFYGSQDLHMDAEEQLQAFFRWIDSSACPWTTFEGHDVLTGRRDPRVLTDAGLQAAYSAWLAQEADQQQREQQESEVSS